jgi:hypothetical protein
LTAEGGGEGFKGGVVCVDDSDAAGEGGFGFGAADDGEVELFRIGEGFENGSSEGTGGLSILVFGNGNLRLMDEVLTPKMATFLIADILVI